MLRMLFTVFNLWPKIPSQEFFGLQDVEYIRSHKFTDIKGLLFMTFKFLDFRRKQDIKFREMDREMKCPIYDLRETHQSSLLGSVLEKSRSLS